MSKTAHTEEARVLARVHKATDLETHVREVQIDGLTVVEFRDYIVSLGEYGRGYWFPAEGPVINEVVQSLLKAMNEGMR